MTSELIELDGQIFRLGAELAEKPEADRSQKLGQLLKARQQLLLKMEREKEVRLSNERYKRT